MVRVRYLRIRVRYLRVKVRYSISTGEGGMPLCALLSVVQPTPTHIHT